MVKLHHPAMSVAAIAAAGAFMALPAVSAGASTTGQAAAHLESGSHPVTATDSDNRDCGEGATAGNEWICVQVHKNNPSYVRVSDKIYHRQRTVQVCLHKDNVRDKCTPFEVINPGQTLSAQYPFEGTGTYCAVAWRLNPDGSSTRVDLGQCVTAS